MATFTRVKVWVSNEVLTAAALNGEFDNIITNMTPAGLEDLSANVGAMQAVTDPGGVGTEIPATTLAGEIQRIRYALKRIVGPQWYSAPIVDLSDTIDTADISDAAITTAKIADEAVTTAKIDDLAVTAGKKASVNIASATKASVQAITASSSTDVTGLDITLNTTNNRPVELRFQSAHENSNFPGLAAITVYGSCDVSDTNVSGAASAGTAHVHDTDVPVHCAITGIIEIYRETTIAAVTDYTMIHTFQLAAQGDLMNSQMLYNELFSYSWLDTDFSDTVGNAMKYKVKAKVSGSNLTGETISFGAELKFMAREL